MQKDMVTVPIKEWVEPELTETTAQEETITIEPPKLDPNSKLIIPDKTQYLISTETKQLLTIVDKMRVKGRNPNILVSGPQGTGKSELATQYAASRGLPIAVLEIGRLSDPSQIFGYMDLKDGATQYVKGLFTEAITTPQCVVHLQEINRPENDKSLNALFSVLDDAQRAIWIDELQDYVRVSPGVTFFASLNEGFEFIGTLPLDEALRSRFHLKIQLEILPRHAEIRLLTTKCGIGEMEANNLHGSISKLRGNTQTGIYISTRDLVYIADLVSFGLNVDLAVKSVVGGSSDTMESVRLAAHMTGSDLGREMVAYEYI